MTTSNPAAIFVGAGDIASCINDNDEATAKLLDGIPGTVFVVGDNVYDDGTTTEYNNCYDPTWGRHKARTKPVPGNHEYNTPGGSGYYEYFGAAAGTAGQGYYSFDLGAWHIIALNPEISTSTLSQQMKWLRADLAAHPSLCTLAYWHEPLYSSTGGTGSGGITIKGVRPFWDTLYAYGAEVVLNGHRHFYERLAPIRPDGTPDAEFGIREIVVGTGGIGGGTITNFFPASEVREGRTFGVLKLYLYDDSYATKFVPVPGKTFTDSSAAVCHGPPPRSAGAVSTSRSTITAAPATVAASSGSSVSSITVTAKDGAGNPVSGATVVLSATGAGNVVTQPASPTDANGAARGSLSSTTAGTKTVSARVNGVAITQASTVTVSPAAASALTFEVQPSTTPAGATISPAVTVQIRDQFGNPAGASADVSLAIGVNPSGGMLGGTSSVAAVAGVATFSSLSIDRGGNGYTLTAAAAGLAGATSDAFDIPVPTAVSAERSTLSVSGGTITTSDGSSTSRITVTALDANGSPVSGIGVILAATGSGNTLTQPAAPTNAAGVATGTLSSTTPELKTVSAIAGGTPIDQTATIAVTPAGGSIGHTLLAAGNNAANQRVYSTASITPVANALVTVAVVGHNAYAPPPIPTLSGGGMSGWSEITSITFDSLPDLHKRLSIFRALSPSPGSGPITITFPVAVSNSQWIVSQWTGVDIGGENGSGAIVQTTDSRADGVSSLNAALAPLGGSGNVAYGVVGVTGDGLVVAPAGGFAEIAEQSSGESPRSVLEAEWVKGVSTVTASWSGLLKAALLAVELKAALP